MKLAWQSSLVYQGERIVWLLLEIAPAVLMINLWQSLLRSGRIDQSQFSFLSAYYLVNVFISRISGVNLEDKLIDDIKDGRISNYLLKPLSLPLSLFAQESSWRITAALYLLPLMPFFLPLIGSFTGLGVTHWQGIFFGLFILLSFLQKYFVAWIIGLTAFWIDESKSLVHARWMAEGIFGGIWLPLTFFPVWWQKIASFSPFYIWYYFPARLLLDPFPIPQIIKGMTVAIIWTLLLYLFARFIWSRAKFHYSAVGG